MKTELIPFKDIEIRDGRYLALSPDAMFEVRFARRVPAGAWLAWEYRTSYLDHLVRPLLCHELPARTETDPMAAPLFGKARWIGQVPGDCRRIFLKPVDRAGPFSFEITACRRILKMTLMPRAFRNAPVIASQSVGAEFILAPRESRQALLYARQGVPLEDYTRWRRQHERPYDHTGFDRPYAHNASAIRFEIIVVDDGKPRPPLAQSALVASLRAQSAPNWRCTFVGFSPETPPGDDSRFRFVSAVADAAPSEPAATYLARLTPDDALAPYAVAALDWRLRDTRPALVYGDEESSGDASTEVRLKPDWSPRFEREGQYLGRAVFWNGSVLAQAGIELDNRFDTMDWRRQTLAHLGDAAVDHLRRIILAGPTEPRATAQPSHDNTDELVGTVRIIVPSKDAPQLIGPCLDGLRALPEQDKIEIVLVDNGSTDREALRLYRSWAGMRNFHLVEIPGKFNYSRMCNAGAAGTRADVLLFLNNDVSMPTDRWLAPLVRLAMRPDIGAVGARLLFPSGTLQHVGVTLGMGGYAAHQYDNAAADEPGHLDRLRVTHELSAVTGACIAVARTKFEQVGGFDAENLPVELNDIDLCLRLNRAGYQTVFCPEAELVHHQSASRGFSYRPFTRYGRERDWFKAHWEKETRDDPFFHPAFSLYSTRIALDG